MAAAELAIVRVRPFLPSKDFAASKRFYIELGFSIRFEDANLAIMALGDAGFLLQNFYVKDWADNFMIQLMVPDLDAWWRHISSLNLAAKYGVRPPTAPKLEPWGNRVTYLWDPAGVLWHVTEANQPADS